jgi:hypothetical protein
VIHDDSGTYFLNGVVTGSERLRFGFMTRGFNRICGPSDDRLGSEVMGGGADDGGGGGGRGGETGSDGMGTWVCIGDWYMSCCGDMRKGLAGVGDTDGMGDMGAPIPKAESCIRLGMAIKLEFMSNPRFALSQLV